ncbi:putative pollen-specific leucine-rich repeat extensin-like protein 3 [Iris pallida]|uniref:Pollen-specific leucine-rich repeat extensin-like protein 3 n=1 Tax=Iris pallida TaxID=29817 RepID=A0AAX6DTB8_IRIPA|nr:putative pollen-specific leucine-rich repeat extensin-like protein 3 [Iris pallida]
MAPTSHPSLLPDQPPWLDPLTPGRRPWPPTATTFLLHSSRLPSPSLHEQTPPPPITIATPTLLSHSSHLHPLRPVVPPSGQVRRTTCLAAMAAARRSDSTAAGRNGRARVRASPPPPPTVVPLATIPRVRPTLASPPMTATVLGTRRRDDSRVLNDVPS